jgi:hypothetical protein
MAQIRPPVADALATLLELSHQLAPEALGPTVREVAAGAGLCNVTVHLVDHEQRTLVPLPPATASLDIDSTMGGRAYRQVEVVEAQIGRAHV